MRLLKEKIQRKHTVVVMLLLLAVCLGFFAFHAHPVFAKAKSASQGGALDSLKYYAGSIGDEIASTAVNYLNKGLYLVVQLLGWLSSMITTGLKAVAEFNGYNRPEVQTGWAIVRDIINSFYIVVLIAIAISTIIRFQAWDFRATLPRLLISAVLVNFSLTICMLAVDFSNSVMATFADGIGNAWPGLLIGLRLPNTVATSPQTLGALGNSTATAAQTLSALTATVALIFSILTLCIAVFAMITYLIILIFRVVMIWLLLILSPLAFFLWGGPGRIRGYWSKWFEEFVKTLIVGPVLLFFLYIVVLFFVKNATSTYGFKIDSTVGRGTLTLISDPSIFFSYIIGISLLFAGLEVANQIGARGTSFARSVANRTWANPIRWAGQKVGQGIQRRAQYLDALAEKSRFIPSVGGTLRYFRTREAAIEANTKETRDEALRQKGEKLKKLVEAGKGGGLGARILAFSGGNIKMAQDLPGFLGGIKAAVTSTKNLAFAKKSDDLVKQKNRLIERNKARTFINSMDGQDRQTARGQTLKDFSDDAAIDALFARRELEQAQQQNASADVIDQHKQTLKEAEEKQKFAENLKKAGAQDNQNIGDFIDKDLKENEGKDKDQLLELSQELSSRRQQGQKAIAAFRGADAKKGAEYRDQTYEKGEKYAVEFITNNALGNANKKNKEQFSEDMLRAADQGAFDNVTIDLMKNAGNPNFKLNEDGIKEFSGYLQNTVGFSEQEALNLLNKVQGRNRSDGRATQASMVGMNEDGNYELTNSTKRTEQIKSMVKKKMRDVLIKGGKEGVGIKQPNGKYELHDGVKEAIMENMPTFKKIMTDRRAATQMDPDMLKMIANKLKENPSDWAQVDQGVQKILEGKR